ncbi:hypothetical protein PAMP_012931 [Pampus punctatissimus]
MMSFSTFTCTTCLIHRGPSRHFHCLHGKRNKTGNTCQGRRDVENNNKQSSCDIFVFVGVLSCFLTFKPATARLYVFMVVLRARLQL